MKDKERKGFRFMIQRWMFFWTTYVLDFMIYISKQMYAFEIEGSSDSLMATMFFVLILFVVQKSPTPPPLSIY